jgi:amidophosphoribosyltransferase
VREVLGGKRVVVVDDSIVRGTTSLKIVKMVRAAGARAVHLRISSPQVAWPCYYGIDTPTRSELIAQSHTVEEINQYLTSDTLAYLPLDETKAAVLRAFTQRDAAGATALNGHSGEPLHAKRSLPLARASSEVSATDCFCDACFSGDYPVAFQEMPRSRQMRLLDF